MPFELHDDGNHLEIVHNGIWENVRMSMQAWRLDRCRPRMECSPRQIGSPIGRRIVKECQGEAKKRFASCDR